MKEYFKDYGEVLQYLIKEDNIKSLVWASIHEETEEQNLTFKS